MTTASPPPIQPVSCPHCGATNAYGAAFCESCGKALPPPVQAGPRVLYGNQAAVTSAGVHVQTEELRAQTKKASQALLLVAVLTTIGAALIAVVVFNVPSRPDEVKIISPADAVVNIVVAAIFWGLFFWARKNPLPAAIVGLVLYVTLTVLQVVTLAVVMRDVRAQQEQEAAIRGEPPPAASSNPIPGGMCGMWLRVLIIVMLIQAITAGVKHRKLLRQQREQAGGFGGGPYAGAPPGTPSPPMV